MMTLLIMARFDCFMVAGHGISMSFMTIRMGYHLLCIDFWWIVDSLTLNMASDQENHESRALFK